MSEPETMPTLKEIGQARIDSYQPLSLTEFALRNVAIFLAISVGAVALGHIRPKGQTPTFAATKIDGCYVSDNWQWESGGTVAGIDDLAIRYVKGPTSEGGKGSKCLAAAEAVIIKWSQEDGYPLNNIGPDLIIRTDQEYAVPYFATATPQG